MVSFVDLISYWCRMRTIEFFIWTDSCRLLALVEGFCSSLEDIFAIIKLIQSEIHERIWLNESY